VPNILVTGAMATRAALAPHPIPIPRGASVAYVAQHICELEPWLKAVTSIVLIGAFSRVTCSTDVDGNS
jgi:hypothetical protein